MSVTALAHTSKVRDNKSNNLVISIFKSFMVVYFKVAKKLSIQGLDLVMICPVVCFS